nr:interleukin-17B [Biomphalaria glabrata]
MALDRISKVLIVFLVVCDVSLSQLNEEEEVCVSADDATTTWASLTQQIPVSYHIHTSNVSVPHNYVPDCPSYSSGYSIEELSLCPWHWAVHTDHERFPPNMVYAVCTCGNCGNPRFGRVMRCRPLYYVFQVVKRMCQNGLYRYFFTQERLPIACLCAHRPVTFITPVPR